MQQTMVQPNASPLSDNLLEGVLAASGVAGERPVAVEHSGVYSNDLTCARFANGRTLMVKQGRYPWVAERFATSRRTAALLYEAGILAPRPLEVAKKLGDAETPPLEVYWRIDLPTLEEVWPTLTAAARRSAMESWGGLIRRLHGIELSGFGAITGNSDDGESLRDAVGRDLGERLLPAIMGEWPEAVEFAERLLDLLPEMESRGGSRKPALVHNDMHMGNVLCRVEGDRVRCMGFLDLEAAGAGVAECDVGVMQVLHGPLFARPVEDAWLDAVVAGYGQELDPWLLRFFRSYHLLNLGFYSALVGHEEHAGEVAGAIRNELDAFAVRAH